MKCTKCNQEGGTGKFCKECGTPLCVVRECPVCHTKSDGKFCPECGAPLGGVAPVPAPAPMLAPESAPDSGFSLDPTMFDGIMKAAKEAENKHKDMMRAQAFVIQEEYEKAREIYKQMINEDPMDINIYMGLISIETQNYTLFEGESIDKSIRYAKGISALQHGSEDIAQFDPRYAEYAQSRKKYFSDKALAEEAERMRKAAEEAERKRKAAEETERKRIEDKKKKEAADFNIGYGCLTKYKGTDCHVEIPDSVTSIGDYAFFDRTRLTSITIPNSVTSIGDYAFSSCTHLTSITIPNSVTSIGNYAFSECTSLTSITIPNSVTSIGDDAFSGCTRLKSISVERGNPIYHSIGNCLIDQIQEVLIAGCKNSQIPTDGSVTSIGKEAFYGCTSLTSITIPNSVTSIGGSAFTGCTSLKTVTIPANCKYSSGYYSSFPSTCKVTRRS